MLKNISVARKFVILICSVFLGMTGLYVISTYTISKTSIGSDTYKSIESSKDLLADILPPPLYVIETYLDALQTVSTTDAATLDKLFASIALHKQAFQRQYELWRASNIDSTIKGILNQELYPTGLAVFDVIETKLKPATQSKTLRKLKISVCINSSPPIKSTALWWTSLPYCLMTIPKKLRKRAAA